MSRRDRRAYLLVTDPEGRVLVLRNKRGSWTLPGGRAHRGEKLRHTAVREVFEETGLTLVPGVRVACLNTRRRRWKVFTAETASALEPRPGREIRLARWVTAEEAVGLLRKKFLRRAVRAVVSESGSVPVGA